MLKELSVRIGADTGDFVKSMTQVSNELSDATADIRSFGTTTEGVMQRFENTIGNSVANAVHLFAGEVNTRFRTLTDSVTAHFNRMSNNINREFNEIRGNFRQMINETEASSDALATVGGNMQTFVTLPLLAAGAASIKLSSDFSESMNKVNVSFGSSAQSVIAWSKTSIEQMGLASGSALDAAALFGDMGTSMGISQQKAADMAMSLTQLGADLASFKNISIDQAMQALNGVFTGETESLKMLGVVMTETQLKAFALEQGITKNVEKMTEAELVSLRYAFVLDRTKNAQGDFARTSEGSANQMRMFTELMKEIGVQLGQVILPVFNDIIKAVNEKLKAFADLSEGTKKLIVVSGLLAAAIGPVLLIMGTIVPSIMTAVAAYRALGVAMTVTAGTAATAGATMGAGMTLALGPVGLTIAAVAALTAAAVAMAKNWEDVSTRVKTALATLGGPIGAVVVAGGYLIKNWEDVKATAWALTQYVTKWWTEAFGTVADFTTDKIGKVKTIITNMQTIFENVFPNISGIFSKAFEIISGQVSKVSGVFNDFINSVLEKLGILFNNSAFAVEMAEYKKQYALEKTIEKMNENAGKTDYMTDRTIILTGQTKELADKLAKEAEEAAKAAEAKRIAAERAKEFAIEQEKLIKSTIDLSNQLGSALVQALKASYEKQEQAQAGTLIKQRDKQKEHYTKLNDELKKQYDKDVSAFKDSQQQKIDELTRVYNEQIGLIDSTARDQIKNLNEQVTAIETTTEEEEKLIRAADFEKARQAKQTAILLADNEAERRKLVEELREMEVKRERELLLEQRRNQIEALRKAADLIREDAEKRKREKEEQYKADVEAEKTTLATGLANLETNFLNRKAVYDGLLTTIDQFYKDALQRNTDYYAKLKAEDALEQTAREGILRGDQDKLLGILKEFNPNWLEAGKTFGEKLLEGILSKSASVTDAVNQMLEKVKPLVTTPSKGTSKTQNTGGVKPIRSAFGGIFTSPTLAMVGDGGRGEAIIPLSRLAEITGNQQTQIFLDGREITRGIAPIMVDTIKQKIGGY